MHVGDNPPDAVEAEVEVAFRGEGGSDPETSVLATEVRRRPSTISGAARTMISLPDNHRQSSTASEEASEETDSGCSLVAVPGGLPEHSKGE